MIPMVPGMRTATLLLHRCLAGLQIGDQVVDDGADRLKDGAKITVAPPAGSAGTATTQQKGGRPHSGHHRPQQGGARQTSE